MNPRTILFPIDITEMSENMCEWACENFFKASDLVVLFAVAKKQMKPDGHSFFGLSHCHGEALAIQHANEWMRDHIVPKIRKSVGSACEIIVKCLESDKHHIAEAIIEESERVERKYEAIVLASHKRSSVKEFFVGSVANHVLHHSKVTVIVQRY
jgi:nucleotide-binding universal stress UspA family protein